jgi:hypothetical protein
MCRAAGVPVFVKQLGSRVLDRNDAGFDGCDARSWPLRPDGCDPDVDHEPHDYVENYQGADCRIRLVDRAGADPPSGPRCCACGSSSRRLHPPRLAPGRSGRRRAAGLESLAELLLKRIEQHQAQPPRRHLLPVK